jgi:multisubunit Na+/H+ antiporter MnhE subunit
MVTFLAPSVLLFPVNLAGLWLTAQGRPAAGTSLLIAAKIVGTAVVAHLFRICRPALLSLRWFRALHDAFLRLRNRLYHSEPWLAAVAWKQRLSRRLRTAFARSRRGFLGSRWQAVRARLRR